MCRKRAWYVLGMKIWWVLLSEATSATPELMSGGGGGWKDLSLILIPWNPVTVVATIGKILSGPSIRKVRFEKLPTEKTPAGSAQYVVKFYVQKAIFPELPGAEVTNGGRRRAILRDGRRRSEFWMLRWKDVRVWDWFVLGRNRIARVIWGGREENWRNDERPSYRDVLHDGEKTSLWNWWELESARVEEHWKHFQ